MSETRCWSMYRGHRCALIAPHKGTHVGMSWTWESNEEDAPWMEAGRHVCWAYEALAEATTIAAQGNALADLSDAVNDLSSFITEFNIDLGLASIHHGDQ